VRLDALSSPSVYQECGTKPTCRVVEGLGGDGVPQGFAKIRVQGEGAEDWAEFMNAAGFLRRSVRFLKCSVKQAVSCCQTVRYRYSVLLCEYGGCV
jgi:hypothetical protein